ncbi:cysteine desulfurase NifS [Anaerotruncus colihominis]|uniref:Cysteine desulfurase IscS n=2 Tax=Anaerotruncus colihominis TaxID=169435 RepID=A0A3E3IKU8_9FIRM|nr:cysteine desulfurase NifS [Anaerotruncus colihominis]OUO67530.1 cysteine desulfurase NifS [Anaerotruncus colihominis]RGE67729.1 cysteine desulfurase NifS [Anaerotruncus colihominis]UOX64708.1 cysteine desulfurase NifS [Anaerotruncus colihominis]
MKQFVYADNAATTQISKEVLDAMMPWLTEGYGNPSSIYELGRTAGFAIEDARKQVAAALGAQPAEIYFTGCGSESDNWAIKGAAHKLAAKGKKHLITTVFEHHAVLHTCAALEKEGFEVTYLPVDHNGLITAQQVADAIRPDTALVSIMYANNEIGTIMPIPEIGALCRERGVWFHTDAVQAVGNIEIDVAAQNIDMLSLSGHKIHAPKGIGALYIKKGIVLPNLIDGGEQERGRRAGTENVASIIGLGRAMEIACADIPAKISKVTPLRNKMIDELLTLPMSRLNGDRERRLAGNANLSFVGAEGEALLLGLDMAGVCASSGSACTTGSLDPSHVLLALGLSHEVAHGSLRITISDWTTPEEVDHIIDSVKAVVTRTRDISPLWEDIQKGRKTIAL